MDPSLLPIEKMDASGAEPCVFAINGAAGERTPLEADPAAAPVSWVDVETTDPPAGEEPPPPSPPRPAAAPPSPPSAADAGAVAEVMEALVAGIVGPAEAAPPRLNAAQTLETLRAGIPAALLATHAAPAAVTPEAAAAAAARREVFHAEHARQQGIVLAKPDVKAVKALQAAHPDWPWERRHGHPPGVLPGQLFSGRAELWMAGAHAQYFRGIEARGGAPAYAIVLSGEYEDDDDHGDFLWYTGEGGRASGGQGQGTDQSFASPGNAALKRAHEEGVPVRVMRGAKIVSEGGPAKLSYTYDGPYYVASAELAEGRSGKLVCRFAMVGLPGHSKATRRVTFLSVRGFRSVMLAGAEGAGRRRRAAPKRRKRAAAAASSSDEEEDADGWTGSGPQNREDYLFELRLRTGEGLIAEDVSGGAEAWPIPAFNDTGDGAPLPVFEYVKDSRPFESSAAAAMAGEGAALMPDGGAWCGLARAAAAAPGRLNRRIYNKKGLMLATNYLGMWECCGGAACGGAPACRRNAVVTRGMDAPLEVFRTANKGWGVRCATPLLRGQVVATYEGELVTNAEAEARRTTAYLYDLDHFLLVLADPSVEPEVAAAVPPLPAAAAAALAAASAATEGRALLEAPDAPHLVIDAERRGNVSRFFNHSCSPNMLVQPVLTAGCSGVRYRIAFVAGREVEAGEELCYNYGTRYFFGSGPCACGAPNCEGMLG